MVDFIWNRQTTLDSGIPTASKWTNGKSVHCMNAAPIGIAVKNRAHHTLKEAVWKEEPVKSAARLTNAETDGCGLVNGAAK